MKEWGWALATKRRWEIWTSSIVRNGTRSRFVRVNKFGEREARIQEAWIQARGGKRERSFSKLGCLAATAIVGADSPGTRRGRDPSR